MSQELKKKKVYFYSPFASKALATNRTESDLLLQKRGLEFWIHTTYFYLSQVELNVEIELTDQIPDSGIIIFHRGFFPADRRPTKEQYFVCCQADYGRHRYAQFHIVQNPFQANKFLINKRLISDLPFFFAATRFVQHWPQPCLIPRDNKRGSKIETISFFGNIEQAAPGLEHQLIDFCIANNLRYVARYDASLWNDYVNTDITLAIRDFSSNPYYHKPYSKILNSILSDSLVIAGPESSNRYFQKHFFPQLPMVHSSSELIGQIKEILKDPIPYFQRQQSCKEKIIALSKEGVVNQWAEVLNAITLKYSNWNSSSPVWQNVFFRSRKLF